VNVAADVRRLKAAVLAVQRHRHAVLEAHRDLHRPIDPGAGHDRQPPALEDHRQGDLDLRHGK